MDKLPHSEGRDSTACGLPEGANGQIDRSFFLEFHARLLTLVSLRIDPRLRGRIDVADVMQEIYLEYMRFVPEYRKSPQLPPWIWLRTIALRKLHAIHRKNLAVKARDAKREQTVNPGAAAEASLFELASQLIARHSTPSQKAIREELQTRVQAALAELSVNDREVLVMRHFELMSNREVALALEISEAAASNRYFRAIRRIKSVLGDIIAGSKP